MRKWILHNFGLKLVSLALAILTWFYIVGELGKIKVIEEKSPMELAYSRKFKARRLPIRPNFQGTVPAGYIVVEEKVAVEPMTYLVLGPEKIVDNLGYLLTKPIDIGEHTKSFKIKIGLQPIPYLKLPEKDFVVVKVQVIKQEQ